MDLKRGAAFAGDFIVEAILARDANSVVFVANQPSRNRLVTIKLFLSGDSGQRFLATYARASQIKSDFVPKLFDLGTLPDGNSYIVREYIEGEDFRAVVSRGALTSMEAVQAALQSCAAVAATHAVGIVHGGLKTSSLILTRLPSGAPVVKVLNCGLVRVAKTDATVTPYWAPEQLADGRKLDGRCDVWAIGAILYELLTREPPFAGTTPKSLSKRILNESPRPLRSIRPDLPPALEAVVNRCLEKSPDARIATIAELATALGPFGTVHTIALPVNIARLKIPPNILRSSGGPPSSRMESANRASSPGPAPPSEPRPSSSSSSVPLQLHLMPAGDEEAAIRKMTSEGRIERLDADAAANVARERRIADQASNLSREARANPRAAPVETEDTGMRVLEEAAAAAAPPGTPAASATEARARWNLRRPVVIVLIAAVWAGLLIALVVRIVVTRPHAERRKPREIIVEDRPTGAPVQRSVP